jgi:imidazoleglycerol-phosphate dehydratase/histidinol-phosphatase
MTKQYVFIEQDGGLLQPSVAAARTDLGALRLQNDCMSTLQRFCDAGFGLVLLADEPPGAETCAAFVDALFASQRVCFDAVQRCRHLPNAGCDCTLPGIGLVKDYVADAGLDRAKSLVVGAGEPALRLARAMGLAGFAVEAAGGWAEIGHSVLDRPRKAKVRRKTRETDITIEVDLDRATEPQISTGIGFFDHMLEQLGKHGAFELRVVCNGDLDVDEHHTVEDVALALGQALREALGDKRGIARYGFLLPMDEAEAQVAIDLSGRAYAVFEGEFPRDNVGGLPTELVGHFFRSLSETLGAAVHISVRGDNAHHMVEACFKGVARTLRQALRRSGSDLPSTKGSL